MIHKAYRIRFYLTREQKVKINQTLGAVRDVYNCFLHEWHFR